MRRKSCRALRQENGRARIVLNQRNEHSRRLQIFAGRGALQIQHVIARFNPWFPRPEGSRKPLAELHQNRVEFSAAC
jgi:hypothetical protein